MVRRGGIPDEEAIQLFEWTGDVPGSDSGTPLRELPGVSGGHLRQRICGNDQTGTFEDTEGV